MQKNKKFKNNVLACIMKFMNIISSKKIGKVSPQVFRLIFCFSLFTFSKTAKTTTRVWWYIIKLQLNITRRTRNKYCLRIQIWKPTSKHKVVKYQQLCLELLLLVCIFSYENATKLQILSFFFELICRIQKKKFRDET